MLALFIVCMCVTYLFIVGAAIFLFGKRSSNWEFGGCVIGGVFWPIVLPVVGVYECLSAMYNKMEMKRKDSLRNLQEELEKIQYDLQNPKIETSEEYRRWAAAVRAFEEKLPVTERE